MCIVRCFKLLNNQSNYGGSITSNCARVCVCVQYVRALCNFNADQPHQHATYYTALLLTQHAWSKEELLAAAKQSQYCYLRCC